MSALAASRRRVLQLGATGLAVAVLPGLGGCALPVIPKRPRPAPDDALGWVHHVDGRTTLILPRVEMGQNILTALKQIVCVELGVAWDAVEARLHATSDIGRVRATVGSESVKDFAVPLAQACAALREALATGQHRGRVAVRPRPLAELRSLQAGLAQRGAVQRLPQAQAGAIVRGEPLFVADVRRPGMVYGRVLRAPASPELRARLAGSDDTAARAVPGFVALVRDPWLVMGGGEGLGIVARTPAALDRVERALAPSWAVESAFEQATLDEAIDIDRRLATGPRRDHPVHDDEVATGGPWDIDLRFDVPLAAHAPIEPRAAVAAFDDLGRLHLWVGSQDVFYQRDVVAKRLGLPEEKVVVHGQRVGGAFGGKTLCTVELEAAVLARASGLPVKVQWSRAQEFQLGFHRPPSSHRIRARLQDGRLQAWSHSFASSHILFTAAVLPPWLQRLTQVIGDDGVARGATLPYRAPAVRTEFDLVRLPVFTGPWRGLGAGPNGYAIESAVDECARQLRADPVQFRLDHLADDRLAGALKQVAAAARWGRALPASTQARRGRGVACGTYKAMSHAAVVADVEVDVTSGHVRVLRLWCAHDCGLVIDPDQVRAQCEGNLVWGLGMALVERLPVAGSQVAASSFLQSPIPRIAEVPTMEVVLVDSSRPPTGAGETAIVAAAAAIANAVRDATGVRPRGLPIQAAELRAGMVQSLRPQPLPPGEPRP